jgi:Pyruvate/2-oxoacid:ferredoxin oxidoreductase gamma subunit
MLFNLMKYSSISIISLSVLNPVFAADDATDTLVNIELASGLINEVQTALPESMDVNQEFLNPSYNPNIHLQQEAHLAITFLDEGAGYRNSLGYFTYANNAFDGYTFSDIDTDNTGHIGINELNALSGVDANMVFNNVSEVGGGGSLIAGDTVVLGGAQISNIQGTEFDMIGGETFAEGTNIGFFLVQNGWDGAEVKDWDYEKTNQLAFYSIDFLNPENSADATINNTDENSRHVAMMSLDSAENEIILGFEDLVRPYGDNDFNDAVFRVRTDPVSALFAQVPTTTEVISMQAAPLPSIGAGNSMALAFFFALILILRKSAARDSQYA